MSCWCDGDDPGCRSCNPSMTDAERARARAIARAAALLLNAAALGEDGAILRAAKAYRDSFG